MKILLTGATGFIGKHFIAKLSSQHEIFTLTRRKEDNLTANTIHCDFAELNLSQNMPDNIDVIVHLAQSRRYREFPDGANDMFAVNVNSTASLLDYAAKSGVKQFILMSTGSVYEPYPKICHEDDKLDPKGYYAASKFASEILAAAYAKKMKVCIFRLFFPYGPDQTARLIPDLIHKVQNGIPITLSGTESGMKITPMYIDDIINILNESIHNASEGIFNLTSDSLMSLKEICEEIGSLSNKEVIFNHNEHEKALEISSDISKLKATFKTKFTNFKTGIGQVLDSM